MQPAKALAKWTAPSVFRGTSAAGPVCRCVTRHCMKDARWGMSFRLTCEKSIYRKKKAEAIIICEVKKSCDFAWISVFGKAGRQVGGACKVCPGRFALDFATWTGWPWVAVARYLLCCFCSVLFGLTNSWSSAFRENSAVIYNFDTAFLISVLLWI